MTASTATSPPAAGSLTEAVSDEVRVMLARRRLRSSVLCGVLGMSSQAVSKKMRGLSAWSLEDLDALARYFGVDANALLPGLGKQGMDAVTGSQMLPHLDSNQEPAGYQRSDVRGRYLRVVRDGVAPSLTMREALSRQEETVHLVGSAS